MLKAEQEAMAREMTGTFWGAAQALLTGQQPGLPQDPNAKPREPGVASAGTGVPVPIAAATESSAAAHAQKPAST